MTGWPARVLVNTVYAYLVEQADAQDRAEFALFPHVTKDAAAGLSQNRAELDATLTAPIGRQAAAEKALMRELGVS